MEGDTPTTPITLEKIPVSQMSRPLKNQPVEQFSGGSTYCMYGYTVIMLMDVNLKMYQNTSYSFTHSEAVLGLRVGGWGGVGI